MIAEVCALALVVLALTAEVAVGEGQLTALTARPQGFGTKVGDVASGQRGARP